MVDFRSQSYRSSYFGYSNANPSFSSSLLDAVYRSIDLGEEAVYGGDGMRKKDDYGCGCGPRSSKEEIANFQRSCTIEKWMEKKAVVRRKSVEDSKVKKSRKERVINSSSSSSDSSNGGFFSSSESESVAAISRPKLVRLEKIGKNHGEFRRGYSGDEAEPKQKHKNHEDGGGGSFLRTKARALKIYTDLKKAKQPISPGRKFASFVNSLFAAGNSVKTKTTADSPSLKSSTVSSASSFSRSCLSKTPSSRGKSSNGVKRSVRFVDDNDNNNSSKQASSFDYNIRSIIEEELKATALEKNRRVEEIARDLLRKYQVSCELDCTFDHLRNSQIDDDDASCASSDLFELDNLSTIGMEELPVYETTRLDDNRAIANSFIL